MMKNKQATLILLVLVGQLGHYLVGAAASSSSSSSEDESKCGLYLAPSSIPGAGLGIFVGDQDVQSGQHVSVGDIVIPIIDFEWHNQNRDYGNFLYDEYTWMAHDFGVVGLDKQEANDDEMIIIATPGVGAATNCHLSLQNVHDPNTTKVARAVKGYSPGVGAISPYYGRAFAAKQYLRQGSEIFLFYGEHYFTSRNETYGYMPLRNDYKVADALVRKFQVLKRNIPLSMFKKRRAASMNSPFKSPNFPVLVSDLWDIVGFIKSYSTSSRILNALPPNVTRIDGIMRTGGTAKQDRDRSVREVSWLEKNGQCLDNIKVNQSDIPDAGRGAFANRWIPKGGLVAPVPLIHLPDSEVLKMFQPEYDAGNGKVPGPNRQGPFTYQLIMNYCFGHQESTLLLCPYGVATSYINHSSKQPNAKIIWSATILRELHWLGLNVESWASELHNGLAFDIVALRDIEEDEEVLIDYGEAWEQAWEKHVQEYVPRDENYMPAYELNELEHIEFRTHEDRDYREDGVELWCRAWYVRRHLKDISGKDIECEILKHLGDDHYMARVRHYRTSDRKKGPVTQSYEEVLWNVPSDAFYFVDIPYSRDHNLFNAFRSPMMIPDDLFPKTWRNNKRNATTINDA